MYLKPPMVYIAGNYSLGGTLPEEKIKSNQLRHIRAFAQLKEMGYLPFSPILTSSWPELTDVLGHGPNNWMEYDIGMLNRCDCLYLIHDVGHVVKNTGVQMEMDWAVWMGKPIFQMMMPSVGGYWDEVYQIRSDIFGPWSVRWSPVGPRPDMPAIVPVQATPVLLTEAVTEAPADG